MGRQKSIARCRREERGFSYSFRHVCEVQRRGEDLSPVLAAQDVQCQTGYSLAVGELFRRLTRGHCPFRREMVWTGIRAAEDVVLLKSSPLARGTRFAQACGVAHGLWHGFTVALSGFFWQQGSVCLHRSSRRGLNLEKELFALAVGYV